MNKLYNFQHPLQNQNKIKRKIFAIETMKKKEIIKTCSMKIHSGQTTKSTIF